MKQKTYFSTIAFLIFFPPTEFFKNWYIYVSDWSCHQKFEKNSPTRNGNISARSWKIWKSHGRLDPTLRMREVVHARSIKFPLVRNNRFPSGRILLWKGDIFLFDRFTGYTKSNQNQFGRVLPFAFALTYYKIYLFFSSLSDFDSFSWRVHLSYGVCRLRACVQLKTLSSLLKRNLFWPSFVFRPKRNTTADLL